MTEMPITPEQAHELREGLVQDTLDYIEESFSETDLEAVKQWLYMRRTIAYIRLDGGANSYGDPAIKMWHKFYENPFAP